MNANNENTVISSEKVAREKRKSVLATGVFEYTLIKSHENYVEVDWRPIGNAQANYGIKDRGPMRIPIHVWEKCQLISTDPKADTIVSQNSQETSQVLQGLISGLDVRPSNISGNEN